MTIVLRAHHLLCVLTYVGRGYSPDFVAGMDAIVYRLAAGESARLTDGPDEICQALLVGDDRPHCHDAEVVARDAAAVADLSPLLGCDLAAGAVVTLDSVTITAMRAQFATGTIRVACEGCSWAALCTGIAADGFSGTRL